MVVVTATLSFIGIALVKGATAVYVRYDNNKQYAMMKTNAPLLAHEALDREKFAKSEAELGFNECQACGFENFKRIAFCNICGEPLSAKSKKRAKKAKVPANTLNSRTKRARKRKEWLRSASTEGGWVRQVIDQGDARFPGFVVTFRFDEAGGNVTTGSTDGKTASLIAEAKRARLELVEASKANPWASISEELKQEALEIAKLDFPNKSAVFVTKSVAALAPAKKQLIQLSLDRGFLLENSLEHISCIDAKYLRAELSLKFLKTKGPVTGKMNRDWIAQLNELLVNPDTGLFQLASKSDQTFYINRNSKLAIGDDHLTFYYAAGRLLGRGLLDSTLWGFHLATPLLKIILGIPVSFTDLEFFDPEEYKNLQWLVHNSGVESLGLDFSVTEKGVDGEAVIVDLVPNGRNIQVTDANKLEYLERRFKYTLFESVSEQLYAFIKGIHEVVPPDMLLPLDPEELDFIMCGTDAIDVDDWKIHSKNNECIHGHPCMRWFWKLVRRMPLEYKRRLLHFTTGNTRVPLGGFAALTNYNGLVAPFTIVGNELVHSRLIRGMPCFNHIELPNYVHKRDLKAALFGILDNYEYVK